MTSRESAFKKIFEPIKWPMSSSIEYRKNLVTERRKCVNLVYPFLTDEEKKIADQWLIDERHEGLWY